MRNSLGDNRGNEDNGDNRSILSRSSSRSKKSLVLSTVRKLSSPSSTAEKKSREKIAKARQKANDLMKPSHFTSDQQKRLQTLKQIKLQHQHQNEEQHHIVPSSPLLIILQIMSGSHPKIPRSKSLIGALLLLQVFLYCTTPLLAIPAESTNLDWKEDGTFLSLTMMAWQWLVTHAGGVILTMSLYSFVFWSVINAILIYALDFDHYNIPMSVRQFSLHQLHRITMYIVVAIMVPSILASMVLSNKIMQVTKAIMLYFVIFLMSILFAVQIFIRVQQPTHHAKHLTKPTISSIPSSQSQVVALKPAPKRIDNTSQSYNRDHQCVVQTTNARIDTTPAAKTNTAMTNITAMDDTSRVTNNSTPVNSKTKLFRKKWKRKKKKNRDDSVVGDNRSDMSTSTLTMNRKKFKFLYKIKSKNNSTHHARNNTTLVQPTIQNRSVIIPEVIVTAAT